MKVSLKDTLFGGCVEVLDWLRGTDFFPSATDLRGAVLFLETSEDAPPPSFLTEVREMSRSDGDS